MILKDQSRCVITLPGCTRKPSHNNISFHFKMFIKCYNMEELIDLDLYELYKERIGKEGPFVPPDAFYICIRLSLACDVVHDFIQPRGTPGVALWQKYLVNSAGFEAYRNRILKDNADRIISDCGDRIKILDQLITGYPFNSQGGNRVEKLISLFNNEKAAKQTIDNIHTILYLQEQNTMKTILRKNACADFKVLDLIEGLDVKNTRTKRKSGPTQFNLTIDTTSDKTNLTPFLSELMNRLYKTKNGCINLSSRIHVINSYATDYDASNENALSKVFKSMGLTENTERNIRFNISSHGANVFQGTLKKEGGKIKLTIESYFKENYQTYMISSSDGPDSVNTITEKMLMSYNAPGSKPEEILNSTIFKTMGDFLQIMSHLGLKKSKPNDVNVFVTFDIICAKIAGMLDRNVFYEKKYTSDESKLSAGLYSFFSANQYNDIFRATGLPIFEPLQGDVDDDDDNDNRKKRKITKFGKKPKVKRLKNKALLTKLKSVGIKITKKQGKRRVYLSRPELIKRATAFKNLQTRAKKLKVRIMYKNKKGKYVYKTAKRLMNDIKRHVSKKKRMKKPVKKSNVKQIKQRFG